MKNIQSKLQLVALLLIGGATQLWAEDKVSIADFTISAGQTATLEVCLDNDLSAYSFVASVALPEGLNYVDGSVKKTSRVTGRASKANFDLQADGTYLITVLPGSTDNVFQGNEGALLTFDVEADEALAAATTIAITGAYYSYKTDEGYKEQTLADATTNVTCKEQLPGVNTFLSEVDYLDVKAGETKEFNVVFNNDAAVASVQGTLTLPAGLTLVDAADAEDGSVFGYTDRIPGDMVISVYEKSAGVYNFTIVSLEVSTIEPAQGPLFSVAVKGDEALEQGSKITIDNLVVGTASAVRYEIDDVVTVTIGVDPTTGIANVANATEAVEYYNLGGMRLNGPAKGVVVARKADGTTCKVRM